MDKMELRHLERSIWVWMFWGGERTDITMYVW